MLQPIETEYRGYRFRISLDARWAVFLDAARLRGCRRPREQTSAPSRSSQLHC
jgi:hypothetical protein